MGDYADSKGSQQGCIVVEWATEKLPGQNFWVCCVLAQQVEGYFFLRQKEVPEVVWKICGHSSKYCLEVGFECFGNPLCRIPSMEIWWHKLVCDVPFLLHGRLVLFVTLIVEDLQVYLEIFFLKTLHDDIVCCQAMCVFSRCKRFKQNGI